MSSSRTHARTDVSTEVCCNTTDEKAIKWLDIDLFFRGCSL